MGVDVASTRNLHVRISRHLSDWQKTALFLGEVDSFQELSRLMLIYRVQMAAIDHLPGGTTSARLRRRACGPRLSSASQAAHNGTS